MRKIPPFRTAIPPALRQQVLARDERTCVYCGEPGNTLDHVYPVAEGGLPLSGNLVVACRRCNSRKGRRLNLSIERESLERAFRHLLSKGESLEWIDQRRTQLTHCWRKIDEIPAFCGWCNVEFPTRTPWQKYCTDSHRVLASRDRSAKAGRSLAGLGTP